MQSAGKNLAGATTHSDVVDRYLHQQLSLGQISGQYPTSTYPEEHISRFGVIPKNNQPNKWHLITDLSDPQAAVSLECQRWNVNNGIPLTLCSLSCVSIDHATQKVLQYGKGTMLAKIDIQSDFCLFPVHAEDCLKKRGVRQPIYPL